MKTRWPTRPAVPAAGLGHEAAGEQPVVPAPGQGAEAAVLGAEGGGDDGFYHWLEEESLCGRNDALAHSA